MSGARAMKMRALTVVAVLAVAAAGCLPGNPPPPVYGSGPPILSSYNVGASPYDQQLTLSWGYSTGGGAPKLMHLDLFQVVNGSAVKVAANIIGRTVEPDNYSIPVPPGAWLVRATPENNSGFGPGVNSPVINVGNPCPNATVCAHVAPSWAPSPVRVAAQGMVHGGVTDSAIMQWLRPQSWRFAGVESDAAARRLHVSRSQIVSDLWIHATAPGNGGFARTPWSNWGAWQSFVQNVVRTAAQTGTLPDYWDVWNEPNGTCCPRFSASDQGTVSVDRWLQMYEIGWKAIKSVDPVAKIVGPSLSALQWAPGAPQEFDLNTFLTYSAAHGLRWDAISWHESTVAPSPGDMMPFVTNIDRHIAMGKAVMARHPGIVVNDTILINEYGGHPQHVLPGWAVGYFRVFEDGGVLQANRACWGPKECADGLDGLVDGNGQITATWWAAKLYGDMALGTRMSVGSSSTWQLDGLATRDDPSSTVKVLLGRHWSCSRTVNPLCSDGYTVPPGSLGITIDWPYGNAPVSIATSRLPAGTGPLAGPVGIGSSIVQPVGGQVTVFVPAVNDGDAISVIAHPA